ncbi:MAG: hypothetical protein ACO3JL_12595 [Myxococcota bacterium]
MELLRMQGQVPRAVEADLCAHGLLLVRNRPGAPTRQDATMQYSAPGSAVRAGDVPQKQIRDEQMTHRTQDM